MAENKNVFKLIVKETKCIFEFIEVSSIELNASSPSHIQGIYNGARVRIEWLPGEMELIEIKIKEGE